MAKAKKPRTAAQKAATANLVALNKKRRATAGKTTAAAPAATKPAAAAKTVKEPAKPASVNTREAMQALLKKVKEEKSADDAKGIIKEVGGVEKMADIPEDKIDAVFDAATAALEDAM